MINKINAQITVGFVGHTSIDFLPELKNILEKLDGFRVIYFTTSSQKLFITEVGPIE